MSSHFEELVISTLAEIKEQVTETNHRVDGVESKLDRLENKVDSLENKVDRLENTVFDIKEMLPTFATKDELRETERRIMDVLDEHTGILQRLDQDRYAEKSRVDRIEGSLNETREHVGLPAM
jgi:chromosome segregation ATPase